MPDIHIERRHTLGIAAAREAAHKWVDQARDDYGMQCSYVEGEGRDTAQFARAGIDGTVEVTAETFTLHATLGFLYGSFSDQIKQRVSQNLDELLGKEAADDDGYNDKDWA